MKISIYSLKRTLFEGEGGSVNCKTTAGEITILNHHRALVTELMKGAVTIVDTEKKTHYFEIASGFLEVDSNNSVKLMVDEV